MVVASLPQVFAEPRVRKKESLTGFARLTCAILTALFDLLCTGSDPTLACGAGGVH